MWAEFGQAPRRRSISDALDLARVTAVDQAAFTLSLCDGANCSWTQRTTAPRSAMTGMFLTARWEHLILRNYAVPRGLLEPLVPRGTELDEWRGEALVSVVGFMFADTRLLGVPILGHRTFEEVNLRFYVRRLAADGTLRRAVVFVRELVPRRAIAAVARAVYNEPYLAVAMEHAIDMHPQRGGTVRYSWTVGGQPYALSATVDGPPAPLSSGSEEEFITEHYWAYTRQRDGGTLEYQVEHPPWRVWTARSSSFDGQADMLYGEPFGAALSEPPRSVFVAEGSADHRPCRLPHRVN